MKYIAAYLLSKAAGNDKPSVEQVKKILEAGGVEIDDEQLTQVVTKMNETTVEEAIEKGKGELAKVSGGAVAASSSAPAAAASEEKPKEEEAEDAPMDMDLGDMFGDF